MDVSSVPAEIKLLPLGLVHSQKGDFLVDEESVELIRNQFKGRALDLVIDYEHQTLKDVQAPAGGWIKDIYKGTDAVMAKVEWTSRAAEYLKNKEYRYLSPVVMVRKRDHKATALHSVALTNTPAIDGMFAIVNSLNIEDNLEDKSMDLKKIAALLGLPETATEEEVQAALAAVQKTLEAEQKTDGDGTVPKADTQGDEPVANSTVLSLLGLKEDARTEDVAAVIMALKAGDGEIKAEVMALKKEMSERNASELVSLALKSGKISAAQTEWAKAYALSDKDGFKKFMDKAPVVVPQGKMELKDAPETGTAECDMGILKNCGVSEEDSKKYAMKED